MYVCDDMFSSLLFTFEIRKYFTLSSLIKVFGLSGIIWELFLFINIIKVPVRYNINQVNYITFPIF